MFTESIEPKKNTAEEEITWTPGCVSCMNSNNLLTTVFKNFQWALRNLGYCPTTYLQKENKHENNAPKHFTSPSPANTTFNILNSHLMPFFPSLQTLISYMMLLAITALLSFPFVISHKFSKSRMTITKNLFSCQKIKQQTVVKIHIQK